MSTLGIPGGMDKPWFCFILDASNFWETLFVYLHTLTYNHIHLTYLWFFASIPTQKEFPQCLCPKFRTKPTNWVFLPLVSTKQTTNWEWFFYSMASSNIKLLWNAKSKTYRRDAYIFIEHTHPSYAHIIL